MPVRSVEFRRVTSSYSTIAHQTFRLQLCFFPLVLPGCSRWPFASVCSEYRNLNKLTVLIPYNLLNGQHLSLSNNVGPFVSSTGIPTASLWHLSQKQLFCIFCLWSCFSLNECCFHLSVCLYWIKIFTLCDPMDCSLPGSSVHGIFQARILGWIGISFFRLSSQTRDQTWVSCIRGGDFTVWASREAPFMMKYLIIWTFSFHFALICQITV